MQNRPKTAKPLAPPSRGAGLDIVAILQESIRESAEKRKKTPGRPAATRRVTPSLKTKRRTGSLGNKAGAGYDLATGLGTIDANAFVTQWNKSPGAVTVSTWSPIS